jgi:hypothetical protein
MKRPILILNLTWLLLVVVVAYVASQYRHQGEPRFSGGDSGSTHQVVGRLPADLQETGAGTGPSATPDSPASSLPAGREITGNAFIDSLLTGETPVSDEQMSQAIAEAFAESDPLKSNMMFARLVELLTPENALATMEAFDRLPGGLERYSQLSLFRFAWGQIDGPAAAAHAATLTGKARDLASTATMSGWATQDPAAASAWVSALDNEDDRERFTRGLVTGLAKSDPEMATSFVMGHRSGDGKQSGEYISLIAREQINRGITEAVSWAENLSDDDLKANALGSIAGHYVSQDPEQAAAWARQYAETGYGGDAIVEVANEWAERDPVAAVDWITSLPEGEDRTRAFGYATWEWSGQDPYAAAEYLTQMPVGDERDAAITGLTKRHVTTDPESAVAWADSISNPDLRTRMLTNTGQSWMRRDPDGAAAWLQASDLPPTVQEEIANPPRVFNKSIR